MLTLLEKGKLETNPLRKGVVEVFPRTSPVLQWLPFMGVSSDSYKYNQEGSLPGISFRGVNQDYDESTGVLNPVTESLTILGGHSDVDRVLVKTQGNINNLRSIHDGLKAKAASLRFTKNFFRGNCATFATQFSGLEIRLIGDQLISVNDSSNATLNLDKVDELIDGVLGGPDVLFMNKTMRRTINKRMRERGQAIETVNDQFGRQINAYAGIPIGIIEEDEKGDDILTFSETGPGTGSTAECTSLYAARFGVKEYLCGLECGDLEVIDHGLYSGGVKYRTTIEWIVGIAIFHPKAASRLYGIKED